jgi:hypothetical protein
MVYGQWKTVYNRHRRLHSADGTWIKGLDGLRVGADLDNAGAGEWVVGVDATAIRAHHQGAGTRHGSPVDMAETVLAPAVLTGGRVE